MQKTLFFLTGNVTYKNKLKNSLSKLRIHVILSTIFITGTVND